MRRYAFLSKVSKDCPLELDGAKLEAAEPARDLTAQSVSQDRSWYLLDLWRRSRSPVPLTCTPGLKATIFKLPRFRVGWMSLLVQSDVSGKQTARYVPGSPGKVYRRERSRLIDLQSQLFHDDSETAPRKITWMHGLSFEGRNRDLAMFP